ncbi:MAG: rRNA maturation RNase YbeY [Gemmobacter sp.]
MEPLVETLIEDDRWLALDLPALAERAGQAALKGAGVAPRGFSLCLMACDDARIAVLNAQFRGRETPTNVLSWPSQDRSSDTSGGHPPQPEPGNDDDPAHLGDVALAFDTCAREAADQQKSLSDHACHLIVHGTLHLLGFDHEDDADARLMEQIEIDALATLGIANPY